MATPMAISRWSMPTSSTTRPRNPNSCGSSRVSVTPKTRLPQHFYGASATGSARTPDPAAGTARCAGGQHNDRHAVTSPLGSGRLRRHLRGFVVASTLAGRAGPAPFPDRHRPGWPGLAPAAAAPAFEQLRVGTRFPYPAYDCGPLALLLRALSGVVSVPRQQPQPL